MQSILVVDDEADIRALLRTVLERDGYSVSEAGNGADALAACNEALPDLILTDLLMPQMSGTDFLDALLQMKVNCKVIVMSGGGLGSDPNSEVARAKELGVDGFIAKPFDPIKVMQICRTLLET